MAGARGIYSEEFKSKVKISVYIKKWVYDKLKYTGNQSRTVEEALIAHNGWTEDNKKG